jgi:hypothetical protein
MAEFAGILDPNPSVETADNRPIRREIARQSLPAQFRRTVSPEPMIAISGRTVVAAEKTTDSPLHFDTVAEFLGDEFKLAKRDQIDLLQTASSIGFVDSEGDGEDRLVFNGNTFATDSYRICISQPRPQYVS